MGVLRVSVSEMLRRLAASEQDRNHDASEHQLTFSTINRLRMMIRGLFRLPYSLNAPLQCVMRGRRLIQSSVPKFVVMKPQGTGPYAGIVKIHSERQQPSNERYEHSPQATDRALEKAGEDRDKDHVAGSAPQELPVQAGETPTRQGGGTFMWSVDAWRRVSATSMPSEIDVLWRCTPSCSAGTIGIVFRRLYGVSAPPTRAGHLQDHRRLASASEAACGEGPQKRRDCSRLARSCSRRFSASMASRLACSWRAKSPWSRLV